MFTPTFATERGQSEYLYTEVSEPGETEMEFIVRIAPKAATQTRRLGTEVCGLIVPAGDDKHKIEIRTSGEREWCALPDIAGAASFHTHPRGTKQSFSAADYAARGYLASQGGVYYQDGPGSGRNVH